MKKTVTILAVSALCATLAVTGLAGCSSTESSTASVLNTSDETSAAGNTLGAYKTQEVLEGVDNASYETKNLTQAEIDDVYTFTLEGTTYTLPCAASEFADAGWSCTEDLTVPANYYMSWESEAPFIYNGDSSKTFILQLLNDTDSEKSWKDCTVVGVTCYDNYNVSFQTSKGIKMGDSFEAVQKAYGASSYDVDRFGSLGYHFMERNDESLAGNRWYGQQVDSLVFTADNVSLYPDWEHVGTIWVIHMDYFKGISASETQSEYQARVAETEAYTGETYTFGATETVNAAQ